MFKFTVTQNSPEILAMEMNGELNAVAAQDLQEEIESLQKDMVKPILIDVTRLNYISSTGLRIFMIIKKTANANGQTVTLKGLNDIVEKVFKMTGFDKMFEIVYSEVDESHVRKEVYFHNTSFINIRIPAFALHCQELLVRLVADSREP